MSVIRTGTDSSLDDLFAGAVIHRRRFLAVGAAVAAPSVSIGFAAPAVAAETVSATEDDRRYMAEAIRQMRKTSIVDKRGEPFGAVIVRDGNILAATGNSVATDNDPTAHAEVNAIRVACKAVGAPSLEGATLYASCEPCPMCYAAAFWAGIGRIYYAASISDFANVYDDKGTSAKPSCDGGNAQVAQIMRPDAQKVWAEYRETIARPRR